MKMIINKHTAILAKEKGFDLPVLGYYLSIIEDEDTLTSEDNPVKKIMDYEEYSNYGFPKRFLDNLRNNFNAISIQDDIEYLSAPNYIELQLWLINNHHIKVLPILRPSGKYSYDIYHYDKPNLIGIHTRITCMNSWSSYEESIENGLIDGLNLISENEF